MNKPSRSGREAPSTSSARRARLAVEPLEDRFLMAAGVLDVTFNAGAVAPLAPGQQTLSFTANSLERAHALAVQGDGKVLAAGVFVADPVSGVRNFGVARFNPDGTLDTTFGDRGKVVIGFGGLGAEARSLALQADGKIVLAGSVTYGPGNDDFALARLNPDGSLDTTFDFDGLKIVGVNGFAGLPRNDRLNGVAVQRDGKIVVAGSVDMEVGHDTDFAVARFNADGSLDASFAPRSPLPGVLRLPYNLGARGFQNDEAFGIAMQLVNEAPGLEALRAPTEKIVLAGTTQTGDGTSAFAAARLNEDGTLDLTFNGTGQRAFNFDKSKVDNAAAVAVQQNGKIVLAGSTLAAPGDYDFAVARLNFDGTLDTSFDKDGRQTVPFNRDGGATDLGAAVAVAQGRIVVAGVSVDGLGNADMAVARLLPDGPLDPAFGAGGKAAVAFDQGGTNADAATAVAIRDGKILLAGFSANEFGADDFAVARLAGSGRPMTQGVFDPLTATWYLRDKTTRGAPTVAPFAYGGPQWIPLAGDWDGDGITTVGVFDPGTAKFYLRNNNTPGAPDAGEFAFGMADWIPLVGDWDGDGIDTVGVFDPGTGTFYLRNSNTPGAPDAGTIRYGGPSARPVVGDWDGDGITTIGVYNKQGEWKLRNSNSPGTPDIAPFTYGDGRNRPVVGDWNGDGITTVGIYNGQGQWKLRNSNSAGDADVTPFAYGAGRYLPVAGSWTAPLTVRATEGEFVSGPPAPGISQGMLNQAAAGALERLLQEGATPVQLDSLSQVKVVGSALPAGLLSRQDTTKNHIVVDDNGAGYGWHVDSTPLLDEEYIPGTGAALPGGPASGRMDLLSTILRQMRRILERLEGDTDVELTEELAAGTRRLS